MATIPRFAEQSLDELMAIFAGVMIVGPRAAGKTTMARLKAKTTLRADVPQTTAAIQLDPDASIRNREEPVLIDEWQAAPSVLGAIKRASDDSSKRGRFILTGSVRADLDGETWPGTGRVARLPLYGLTQGELEGSSVGFIDAIFESPTVVLGLRSALTVNDYIERTLRSGFPDAALLGDSASRSRWLNRYIDELIRRDVQQVHRVRQPQLLLRFLRGIATFTAQIPSQSTLQEAAGINRSTAAEYLDVLQSLFFVEQIPAWWSNRLSRLVKSPKLHIVDPALSAQLLGVNALGILDDAGLRGQLIESFVVSQLRAELTWSKTEAAMFHFRTSDGRHEVDILLERSDGAIVGIEVKAGANITRADGAHLMWLREQLGDKMIGGIVLHTGSESLSLGDGIVAAPIESLWSKPKPTPHV